MNAKPIALSILGIGLACVVFGGLWLVWKFDPADHSFFPPCQFHRLTGLHCPGCGATRAAHALLHGDIIRAVRCNGLLVIGGPLFLLTLLRQRSLERRGIRAYQYLALIAVSCVVAFTVMRNVPSPRSSPFAPPDTAIPQVTPGERSTDLTRRTRLLDYGV